MAHFARINADGVVQEVTVVPDDQEHRGQEFLNEIGLAGTWIQTSITNRIRKVYAQPGFEYLQDEDVFKPNRPEGFTSWVFDEESWSWQAPIAKPETEEPMLWDEEQQEWAKFPVIEIPAEESPIPEGWTRDEGGKLQPPYDPPNTGTSHYWDGLTSSWIDTGEPIPQKPLNIAPPE